MSGRRRFESKYNKILKVSHLVIYKNIKSKTLVSPQVIFAEQQLALGIKFASIYAVLFMPALEEQILSKIKKKLSVW